jgi:hypothetical protein
MSQSTVDHMAMTSRSGEKPGLFPTWIPRAATRRGTVPLAITLPLTMAVSCILWAGIILVVRALI